MRISVVGKGGSGKTTVAALLVRSLMQQQKPVLAIDADINQHLGHSLGLEEPLVNALPELGNSLPQLKRLLKGSNPRIGTIEQMVKTTLPGAGSHLVQLQANDAVLSTFALRHNSLFFVRVGGFTEEDIGSRCFHAKTGGAELLLNHVLETAHEWVVMDMTAGADAFASGLFTRFDLTVVVVEPTQKSLSVYQQYKAYAHSYNLDLVVVGNKVNDADDLAFLQQHCGDALLAYLGNSAWVRHAERGTPLPLHQLEPANQKAVETILQRTQQCQRNWHTYWEQGIHFHNKNALAWANDAVGCDVRTQTDHDFLKNLGT